ncbi:MAG TPA: HDOD domain-containing protein, partial [Planctomycetes bacterium]|nr:HDOD domain-containing protein [Planctomycetota bacterium]
EIVSETVTIPTIPTTLQEINRIINDPDGSAAEASEFISKDVAIAPKVLRLANSPLCGLRNPVSEIQQAVTILGLKMLRNLVLQATVLENLCPTVASVQCDPRALWDHSFKVAQVARTLTRISHVDFGLSRDEAYTAGLLHDVGKVLLLNHDPDKIQQALTKSTEEKIPMFLAEEEAFGFNHSHIGAVLAESWGLGECLHQAILYHHEPPKEGETEDQALAGMRGTLIRVSNSLAHRFTPTPMIYTGDQVSEETIGILKLGVEAMDEIEHTVKETRLEG